MTEKKKEKGKERGRVRQGGKRYKGGCEVRGVRIAQGQSTQEEVVFKCLHKYIHSSLQKADANRSFLECGLDLVTHF